MVLLLGLPGLELAALAVCLCGAISFQSFYLDDLFVEKTKVLELGKVSLEFSEFTVY